MLAGLTYYCVGGGPMGSEVAVKAGGAAGALLGFLAMPLIWSLPEALMTAGKLLPPPLPPDASASHTRPSHTQPFHRRTQRGFARSCGILGLGQCGFRPFFWLPH